MGAIMTHIELVSEYQCPGCIHGPNPAECSSSNIGSGGCMNHSPGTFGPWGVFALGFPRGFCRTGKNSSSTFDVYDDYEKMIAAEPNLTTIFSVCVWKYLDTNGNTITRWFSPRTNAGWSIAIGGDCRYKFPNAHEITQSDIDGMD